MSIEQEFWVHCECGHEWIAAYLPMSVDTFVKTTKGARCPKCAGRKIFCGPNPPKVAKAAREAGR